MGPTGCPPYRGALLVLRAISQEGIDELLVGHVDFDGHLFEVVDTEFAPNDSLSPQYRQSVTVSYLGAAELYNFSDN